MKPLVVIGVLLATFSLGVWVGRSSVEPGSVAVRRVGAVDPAEMVGPCAATRFVDGDTVDVLCGQVGTRVRLLNIDTPERGAEGYGAATEALRRMATGKALYLVFEHPYRPARGIYGRLLAYLYVDDVNLNLEMVRAGWTPFYTKYGAGRFPGEFYQAEEEARRSRLGLWAQ